MQAILQYPVSILPYAQYEYVVVHLTHVLSVSLISRSKNFQRNKPHAMSVMNFPTVRSTREDYCCLHMDIKHVGIRFRWSCWLPKLPVKG